MSPPVMTFRLLDERTGWDARPGDGLAGAVIEDGVLRLAAAGSDGNAAARALAARISRSRRDGTWWLGGGSGVRRLGPCDAQFVQWRVMRRVRAVAAGWWTVAVAQDSGAVTIFDAGTGARVGATHIPGVVAIRATERGFVARTAAGDEHWVDLSGLVCRSVPGCTPGAALPPDPKWWAPPPAGLTIGEAGFCIAGRGCFDWRGRALTAADLPALGTSRVTQGQYLSLPLDSGIPGCRWHRVRIDADIPDSCGLEAAVATTDGPARGRTPPAPTPGPWQSFPTGDPHPDDWYSLGPGVIDDTLQIASGRYAYLRIRLTGDGRTSAQVHQVRLDLPRHTTLDLLPAAYAADPVARDFSERFVSLFDAQIEEIDEVIARQPALFDAAALPDDALGWLGGLIGIGFEPQMTVARRRALLAAAPDLFRRRGTPGGLVDTLRIALGVTASLEELGTARPWGAVGSARTGSVRLFGRSRARVLLGSSILGRARIHSDGKPDDDAVLSGAGRLRVHVGPGADVDVVTRVVRSQSPAPTQISVLAAAPGVTVGGIRVGVQAVGGAPDPAVVGTVVLRRHGVLRGGRRRPGATVVGQPLLPPRSGRELVPAAPNTASGADPCEESGTE